MRAQKGTFTLQTRGYVFRSLTFQFCLIFLTFNKTTPNQSARKLKLQLNELSHLATNLHTNNATMPSSHVWLLNLFKKVKSSPFHPCADLLWGTLLLPVWYIPFHCQFHLSFCFIGAVFPERWSPFGFVLFHICPSVIESLVFSSLTYLLLAYTHINIDYE